MFIYLFRDENESENFAFSVDMTGANVPPITPYTEWIFLEAVNTLKFVEPWDIGDFRQVPRASEGGWVRWNLQAIVGQAAATLAGVLTVDPLPATLFVESEGKVFTLRTRRRRARPGIQRLWKGTRSAGCLWVRNEPPGLDPVNSVLQVLSKWHEAGVSRCCSEPVR